MLCGLVHVCAQEHLHATQPSLTVTIFLERGRFGPIGSRALSCSTVASWGGMVVEQSSCQKRKELEPRCPLW